MFVEMGNPFFLKKNPALFSLYTMKMFSEKFMKLTWIVSASSLWDRRHLNSCELYTEPHDGVAGTRRFL
jgi:hypothetical protein